MLCKISNICYLKICDKTWCYLDNGWRVTVKSNYSNRLVTVTYIKQAGVYPTTMRYLIDLSSVVSLGQRLETQLNAHHTPLTLIQEPHFDLELAYNNGKPPIIICQIWIQRWSRSVLVKSTG